MTPMLVDSHCHLALDAFDEDRAAVLARARAAGVGALVDVGIGPGSWERTLALAAAEPIVHAALGLHPNDAETASPDVLGRLTALLREPAVVAIGETGLDYHWDRAGRAAQRRLFEAHLDLARVHDLPVIIHCRAAYDDMLDTLAGAGAGTRGVLHCFGGTLAQAERGLALGYHISVAGPVTFKKADELRAVAAAIPLDRLLIETDAPYLTPHPHRGQRNEPAYIVLTASAIAAARQRPVDEIITQTGQNALTLFGLPPAAPAASG